MKWKELRAFLNNNFDDDDYIAVVPEYGKDSVMFFKDATEDDQPTTEIVLSYGPEGERRVFVPQGIQKYFRGFEK